VIEITRWRFTAEGPRKGQGPLLAVLLLTMALGRRTRWGGGEDKGGEGGGGGRRGRMVAGGEGGRKVRGRKERRINGRSWRGGRGGE
jgi:hypothetical protein